MRVTTLQRLDQLCICIDLIAQYEIGSQGVNKFSYCSCLEMAAHLAEQLDMPYYAAQCREKLTLPQNV